MPEYVIEYHKKNLLPTCLGNERIQIDANGKVFYSRNSRECDEDEVWSDPLTEVSQLNAAQLRKLMAEIKTSGVMKMPVQLIDDTAEGGMREELSIVIDDKKKYFTLQNSDHAGFKKAIRKLYACMYLNNS